MQGMLCKNANLLKPLTSCKHESLLTSLMSCKLNLYWRHSKPLKLNKLPCRIEYQYKSPKAQLSLCKIPTISMQAMQNLKFHSCHEKLLHSCTNNKYTILRFSALMWSMLMSEWPTRHGDSPRRCKSNRNEIRPTTPASRSFCLRIIKSHGNRTLHHLLIC
jgi:hypothetical protein